MKSMRSLYKKLFHYVPDKRIWAYFSMALSAAAVCSYMGAYWFLWQSIVSILVIPVYEKAMYDAIIVVILMILRGILNIASATCSHYLGFRLETNLRKNGLHKLLDASSSFFDHNSSGEIRKIIDDNAAETHKTVAHLIPDNVTAVMTPVLMFVLMFAIDYRLGILLILTTVIGVLQYRKMSGGTEFLSGYSAALQKMSAATVEYVRGMQIIKIFGVTVQYYKTLINSIKEYKQYVYQYSLSCKNPYVGFQVLFNVFYAFAVPAAVVFISYGEPAMLILAKIVFFAVFSGAVFTSFTSIMFTGQDNFGAQNTLNRLDELTTSMDQAKLPHGNEETFQDFNIEFRHVDFKYDDNFVLKDFSLTLHQNKTYALIGSSGGGKSTIAKLISGFYPVDGGEILIGGKNIQSYSEKALIQNIAFVFQRSQLLKTSIYENVRIGNPQATRQQIMDALDAANCTSILDKFPQREMTVIGAKGVYLSGGEVQRIAIARAILKNANIVIMDEASAAADPENEYELQQAFQKLMRGKTVIMIAHRLSSIQNVDQILFVQNGKVVEQGTHNELMACNGRYTEISQDAAFGHAMDDSTNQTRYLGMNLNKAPFNDPLVREAVSYAVNQQELETSVFDGLETAAETLFPNEKPNCGVEVKTYPTDMEKAKQLMKEAGYEDTNDDGILEKDGTSLAIHFNYSQSLASVDNAVLSIAASLKELGFDVTIDAVDMNTWYGALMAGEYDLTFYNTAGGSFDPATDMSNMAPGAMGDPILCQFSAFFENPEIFAELDSTSDSQRVQEIYGMILNGIADQNLLVPVTGTHDLALWNTDKITGYDFYTDASYVDIASVHVK